MAAHGVLQWLRLLASATGPARPDHELVSRFVDAGDQAAFTVLVQRHGPMVYGVCQRLLEHGQDAEDAFQATFLVFARKARSIRKHASVSCWLYGVASRVAANLRRKTARERRNEAVDHAVPDVAAAEVSWRDVRGVLDEELAKLPERLRLPVVLCYLDGKTRDEAAQELAVSESTLRGRLERGRDLLRGRLTSRGVTLSAALLASLLSENAASALPGSLVASTVNAVGKPLAGVVSAKVIGLVLMEVNAMFVSKLMHVAVVVCVAALVLGGAAVGTGALLREEKANEAPIAQKKAEEPPAKAVVGEHDDFVRGNVGKMTSVRRDPSQPRMNAYILANVTGEGIPKGTRIIVALRKGMKIEELIANERKVIPPKKEKLDFELMPKGGKEFGGKEDYLKAMKAMRDGVESPPSLPFRAVIAIERGNAGEIKKDGNTWVVEPKAVLILKAPDNSITANLGAKAIQPRATDDDLQKLLIEKHNAGAHEVNDIFEQLTNGRLSLNQSGVLNDAIGAIQRYTEAKLELTTDPADRIAVRKRCVAAFELLENELNVHSYAGKGEHFRYERCVQARLEAEIQLLKEQRRAK